MPNDLAKGLKWGHLSHRYQRSSSQQKSQLLDELCDLYEMNRKYLIRKLNDYPPSPKQRRGRKPDYDPSCYLPILKTIWLASDQLCSKKLKAVLPLWLPFYEKHHGPLDHTLSKKLCQMSPATIDRLLKPVKVAQRPHGLSGTKPGSLLKNQIPIKTNQWDEQRPGFMEADTVAHCGTNLAGDFIWTLTMTDILTTWTENRAVWNKGATGVAEQIQVIEKTLPFRLRGFDCDNGSEFLNHHLIRLFAQRPKHKAIEFTRSRPYKKNDNAHVEQKNWTHVRQLLGYHRLDNPQLVTLLNELYSEIWRLYQNFFIPTMKCVKKIKVNSTYKKKYDQPKTPYQRVLDCPQVSQAKKRELKKMYHSLDPFELKKQLEEKLSVIFKLVKLNTQPRTKI